MKMTNKTFDTIRFIAEVIGYIVTFALAVSEIIGFKYGAEATAIAAALMTCVGAIVIASRKYFNGNEEEETEEENVD